LCSRKCVRRWEPLSSTSKLLTINLRL
jgi:hypothetical protein